MHKLSSSNMMCQLILMLIVALDKFVCICISICEGVRFIMKRNCDTVLEGVLHLIIWFYQLN